MRGLEATASKAGYGILTANTDDDTLKEKRLLSHVQKNRADAVQILGGRPSFKKEEILANMPPIVAVNERIVGLDLPTVAIDGYYAAKEIVRYLVGLGHRRLGHISGPADKTSSAADRLQGFHDILEESNLELTWIFSTEYNVESGALAAREWITLPERPTAVLCSSDEVAVGFNSAL